MSKAAATTTSIGLSATSFGPVWPPVLLTTFKDGVMG
jgi:hypothetical protein